MRDLLRGLLLALVTLGPHTAPASPVERPSLDIPGLYLLHFASPVRQGWIDQLTACGAEVVSNQGDGTFLVRASDLSSIQSCGMARFLAWTRPYRSTDRLSPAVLTKAAEDEAVEHWLRFAPGTDPDNALAELPAAMEVLESYQPEPGGPVFLRVLAGAPELEALAATSANLLAVTRPPETRLFDERQGQIVAGNHDGRRVTRPGYLTWLAGRGLLPGPHPQTVALFDIGFDDGSGPEGSHHPDLENPERLVDSLNLFTGSSFVPDPRGHGTMVAGIVSGEGTGTGVKDAQGFHLGTGVAPRTRLVAVKIFDRSSSTCDVTRSATQLEQLDRALSFGRTTPSGGDKSFLANHSWGEISSNYGERAALFDRRVIDADVQRPGLQPMTMIFGAGNGGPGFDTVSSPAVAKNVIAVGSSENFRPSVQPGAAPLTCLNGVRNNEDGRHIGRVNQTSGRGMRFAPWPDPAGVHNTRVKPDLVAPGGRVFSTVPYQTPETYTCPRSCRPYWPDPPTGYHSYVQATSYSAPVVTGMAVHKRQWFLSRGTDPAPSLIKAALVATADDLGSFYTTDHRPSPLFGWGRANLDRLTDPAVPRFFVNEDAGQALATGEERSWTRTLADPSRDVAVVLVWSDPAAPVTPHSQAALLNDLMLTVERPDGTVIWRGNNFNENITGRDDGYSHPFAPGEAGIRDAINTVEAVFLPAGTFAAGQKLVIRVAGLNVTEGRQPFAVYAYNLRPRR